MRMARVADDLLIESLVQSLDLLQFPRLEIAQDPPERDHGSLVLRPLRRARLHHVVQRREGQALLRVTQELQLGIELVPGGPGIAGAGPIEALDEIEIRAEAPD